MGIKKTLRLSSAFLIHLALPYRLIETLYKVKHHFVYFILCWTELILLI